MWKALSFLFNLVVLIIVLKIFAPGVAAQLIELTSNTLAALNDAVIAAHQAALSTDTWDMSQ